MTGKLDIAPGLQLPIDAVTQTFALLGKRGVGKTHGAAVLAEELLERQLQVVILDPIGVWWGLRSSADGKSSGHRILVLGGEHGDLPLEPSAGKLVADFVVTKRASVVIDLGEFGKGDQARFVTEFLERLFQKNREPLQLIIDEADAFAPQRIHRGGERCFGAVDSVVRRGRARGIGVTLVTQRSAAINKDVLTQVEVLIAFRTLAPQDRAAIEAWVEVHGDRDQARAMLGSLHQLAVGEAWVWSPAWLEQLTRIRVRRRRTFDSSATPEVGHRARAPHVLAPVELDRFKTELAELVQKAEQEDPRRLRARIAELERAAAARPKSAPAEVRTVERPILTAADRAQLERLSAGVEKLLERIAALREGLWARAGAPIAGRPLGIDRVLAVPPRPGAERLPAPPSAPHGSNGSAPTLDRASRSILAVLANQPEGCDSGRLTLLAGYRWSGGFRNALSSLRSAGLIEGGNVGVMRITQAGLAAAGDVEPLPTGRGLIEYWLTHQALGAAEREVLRQLVAAFPRGLTSEQLMEKTGYSWSGGFRNALSKLRTAGLLEGRNTEAMRASATLFDTQEAR